MSSYSLKNIFGDKTEQIVNAPVKGGGTQYKNMVPPTKVNDDGSIEITDFVQNVTVKEWSFDEAKNQLVVTFQDGEGATIREWYSDPEFDTLIGRQEDPAKKETMIGMRFNTIKNIVTRYVYTSAVNQALVALGDNFTFKQFVETLGEVILGDKNKIADVNVGLKLLFADSQGVEEKYRVGRNNWIGNYGDQQWGPKFNLEGQYADKIKFDKIEKTPDFGSGINDIFATNDIGPLL